MPVTQPRLKISEYSERRKLDMWAKSKKVQVLTLSLTSLVDVFAILVIYLLINQTTVSEWISAGHDIELPKAAAAQLPAKTVAIQVSPTTLYVDGQAIDKVSNIQNGKPIIDTLRAWLKLESGTDPHVNIIAHGKLPYGVIRRVINTCHVSKLNQVNLVVQPSSQMSKL